MWKSDVFFHMKIKAYLAEKIKKLKDTMSAFLPDSFLFCNTLDE